jgi:hypothetical protein
MDWPGTIAPRALAQERGRHRIPDEDKPAKTPRSIEQMLARCGQIDPHLGTSVAQMHRRDGQVAIRRIEGLTALARKHCSAPADDACAAALDCGLSSNPYQFVRGGLELRPVLTLCQVDFVIRQLFPSLDSIDQKTQEKPE